MSAFSEIILFHLLSYGAGVWLGFYFARAKQAAAPVAVALLRPLLTPTPIPTGDFFTDRPTKVLCVHGMTPRGDRLAVSIIAENNADLLAAYDRVNGQIPLYPVGGTS